VGCDAGRYQKGISEKSNATPVSPVQRETAAFPPLRYVQGWFFDTDVDKSPDKNPDVDPELFQEVTLFRFDGIWGDGHAELTGCRLLVASCIRNTV
jgi:hypothetical protein